MPRRNNKNGVHNILGYEIKKQCLNEMIFLMFRMLDANLNNLYNISVMHISEQFLKIISV